MERDRIFENIQTFAQTLSFTYMLAYLQGNVDDKRRIQQ